MDQQAVSKYRKLSSVEEDIKQQCFCVDRISNLPSDLIGNILSLLPTKQAVATCVLSSEWKWFWTFITRLKLDGPCSVIHEPSFISFVYRLLLYRKPTPLDYLSVVYWPKNNIISHLRAWVSAALMVDVKELHLSVNCMDASHVLPSDLFSCKKLVKLMLDGISTIHIPAMVCLPNLQVLRLNLVRFIEDDSLKRLLMGCPVLEELRVLTTMTPALPQELFSWRKLAKLELIIFESHIDVPTMVSLPSLHTLNLDGVLFRDDDSAKRLLCGCPSLQKLDISTKYLRVLYVAAPFLSNLTISFWGRDGVYSKLVLETPSLRYLTVVGMSADCCELTNLNQLVEAHVERIYFIKGYKVVTNLIMGLSNVKALFLCSFVMEVIVKSGCELPKFHNLTTLKLGSVGNDVGWTLLPDLLEKSPFLETLVFYCGLKEHRHAKDDCSKNATWQAPKKVPYCLLHHLKVIKIYYFEGAIEEEEIIRYFIENKGVLKDLTIQYSRRGEMDSGDDINVVAY